MYCTVLEWNIVYWFEFCTPKLRYDAAIANIKINHISLLQVQFAKYFDVYIDEHLSWHKYLGINSINNKYNIHPRINLQK